MQSEIYLWGSYSYLHKYQLKYFLRQKHVMSAWPGALRHLILPTVSPVSEKYIREPSSICCTHAQDTLELALTEDCGFVVWQCFSCLHRGRRASTTSISWAEPEQSKYVDAALGLPPFLFALTTKHSVQISAASQHLASHASSSQSRSDGCKRSSKPSVWSWARGYNTYSFAGVL